MKRFVTHAGVVVALTRVSSSQPLHTAPHPWKTCTTFVLLPPFPRSDAEWEGNFMTFGKASLRVGICPAFWSASKHTRSFSLSVCSVCMPCHAAYQKSVPRKPGNSLAPRDSWLVGICESVVWQSDDRSRGDDGVMQDWENE